MPATTSLRPVLFASVMFTTACTSTIGPNTTPPGQSESTKTRVLEAGSVVLQTDAPLDPMSVYLVGFHPARHDPGHQMEAHHFCKQVNEDFAQCVLFDGNSAEANLNGVEYIISERLFESLPDEEKQYWHPHNYEILSGQLIAPGLPDLAEKELMESKINSYGKTWHFWRTGTGHSEGENLPLGEPELAWSFNRDGEVDPELIQRRDERMRVDTEQKRQDRQSLVEFANPQHGVDLLKDDLSGTQPIPGIEDVNAQ